MTGRAKPLILVVDDDAVNRDVLEAMLTPFGYDVVCAADGHEALLIVAENPPDLVLLDLMMPRMHGYDVLSRWKSDDNTRDIPVVMVTAAGRSSELAEAFERGVDDFLSKPVDQLELRARVRSLLKVKAYNDHMRAYQRELEEAVERRTSDLAGAMRAVKEASLETILRLSRAAEHKDGETFSHVLRVSQYAGALAKIMGMDEETVEGICYSAPLHDIGKIGIPDQILLKPGNLTADEEGIMRRHTLIGARILADSNAPLIRHAESIARSHHERWDGRGYPEGRGGNDIPFAARITALADVFDALNSERPYKRAYSIDEAFGYFRNERGQHFDPDLVDAFLDNRAIFEEILHRFSGPDVERLSAGLFNGSATGPGGSDNGPSLA